MTGSRTSSDSDVGRRPWLVPDTHTVGSLWLVRHGETEWSRDGKHTSTSDIPLTPHGQRQARALAPILGQLRPALVLCSPRSRAVRTAELAELSNVEVDEDLAEWDYGEYEGLTTAEIRETRPGWTIWKGSPQGGETIDDVSARIERVIRKIDSALTAGDVIAIGHGHAGQLLAAQWLGLPAAAGGMLYLTPAEPCELGVHSDLRVVRRWNMPNEETKAAVH